MVQFSGLRSGAITLIGLIVATRNVNRQLQVSLLIREETRMEEELPGLKQAFEFVDYCRSEFLPDPDLSTCRERLT